MNHDARFYPLRAAKTTGHMHDICANKIAMTSATDHTLVMLL